MSLWTQHRKGKIQEIAENSSSDAGKDAENSSSEQEIVYPTANYSKPLWLQIKCLTRSSEEGKKRKKKNKIKKKPTYLCRLLTPHGQTQHHTSKHPQNMWWGLSEQEHIAAVSLPHEGRHPAHGRDGCVHLELQKLPLSKCPAPPQEKQPQTKGQALIIRTAVGEVQLVPSLRSP